MTSFLAILPDGDYFRRRNFVGKKNGTTQSTKTKEGEDQFKTAGAL